MNEVQRFIEPPLWFRQVKPATTDGGFREKNIPWEVDDTYTGETGRWEEIRRINAELDTFPTRAFWLAQFLSLGKVIEKHNRYGYSPLKQNHCTYLWYTGQGAGNQAQEYCPFHSERRSD